MSNRLLAILLFFSFLPVLFAGCGPSDPGGIDQNQDEELDAGTSDIGGDDIGDGDGDPDAFTGEDAESDVDEDRDTGPSAPSVSDFIVCDSNADCPINRSTCVKYIEMNRVDSNGVVEVVAADIFEDVAEGQGLCTEVCSADPTVCSEVRWDDDRGVPTSSTCLVVAVGESPYEFISEDPFEAVMDFEQADLGQAFAAICLPPFGASGDRASSFCSGCTAPEDCGGATSCFNTLTDDLLESPGEEGASFCLESCESDQDCPMAFSCSETASTEEFFCVPFEDTCTDCVDRDQDGFGTGHCGPSSDRQTPYDCDDTNADAYYDPDDLYHSIPEFCGNFDFNCDGIADNQQQVGVGEYQEEHCTGCYESCTGTVDLPGDNRGRECMIQQEQTVCDEGCISGWANCTGDLSDGCNVDISDESHIFYRDFDGDGFAADDAVGEFFCTLADAVEAFALEQGAPAATQTLGDCDDADDTIFPGAPNFCDGIDRSCTGEVIDATDDSITGVFEGENVGIGSTCTARDDDGEPLLGVCAEGEIACGGNDADGWGLFCEQVNQPEPVATCNGLDDSCVGRADDHGNDRGPDYDPNDPHVVIGMFDGEMSTTGEGCIVPDALGICSSGEIACGENSGQWEMFCLQTVQPTLEEPGFDGVDHSCDGADRYMRDGVPHRIYVAHGQSGDVLSQAVMGAVNPAVCPVYEVDGQNVPCDVFVQEGGHSLENTLNLVSGVNVYGGFTSANMLTPTGSRTQIEVKQSPGLRGLNITESTEFQNITLWTSDMTAPSCEPNIGALCTNCPSLKLNDVTFRGGAGASGIEGMNGMHGEDLEQGAGIAPNYDEGWGAPEYAFNSYISGADQILNGGWGLYFRGGDVGPGTNHAGQPGGGPLGGEGGNLFVSPATWSGEDGGNGRAYSSERPPNHFTMEWQDNAIISTCRDLWNFPPHNSNENGSGGGASAGLQSDDGRYFGSAGGGGGAAGMHGSTASAGSPSIGMLLRNTPSETIGNELIGIEMNNVRFETVHGGAGGKGGNGGDGGPGGISKNLGDETNDIDTWKGGDGGHGANGSGGGGGSGGTSIGLFRLNSTLGPSDDVIYSPGPGGVSGEGGQPGTATGAESGPTGTNGRTGLSCDAYVTVNYADIELNNQSSCQQLSQ